jgi:hypothetical protein
LARVRSKQQDLAAGAADSQEFRMLRRYAQKARGSRAQAMKYAARELGLNVNLLPLRVAKVLDELLAEGRR